ncbi:uncharacterized protein LOC119741456 [Patiria miniata]|uniref:Uncharacterized protein n=1 Tax=Patiria miniata TaxID=46514 RepID=A0A914BAU3_PATMI|nr:uncharacterized protein LOC119741456 [Patiria miniata]
MAISAQRLRELPGNDRCADCQDCDCPECGFPDPVWANEELGILVCEECMDLHYMLNKASFKSILCQDWTEDSYKKMASKNNRASNEYYEKHLCPAYKKPTRCFNVEFRRQWIMSKYPHKEFVSADDQPKYMQGQKSGYLWKLGRDSQVFQRRWFVLDPSEKGTLRYYTDANEQSLRGEISLFKMNLVLASSEKIGHPNGLQIVYPDKKGQNNTRMIYLYAELAKDMVEWFQAVRCLKYFIQKRKSVETDENIISRILKYDILKEGYLFKTGSKGKEAFRKRWIVLDKLCLMYFKDPLDANPKGTIPMKGGYSLILSGQLDPEHQGFHFYLKTPGRIYHFIAESDHERKAWFNAIHAACNRASGVISHKGGPKLVNEKWVTKSSPAQPTASTSKPKVCPPTEATVSSSTPGDSISNISKSVKTSPIAAGATGGTSGEDSPELDGSFEILSAPFAGIRPSTKPRPQHTLPAHHKRGGGRGAGGQGRYNQAELKHQPAVEIPEDNYIEFTTEEGEPLDEEDTEESSDEDEESPYVELDGEKVVMMQKVDMIGMTTKQLSTHLKVPRKALPQSSSCTMCVSLVWDTLPNLPESEACVLVSPIVSCCSMPRNVTLLQPFQLEIQHSAILKDVDNCTPNIWHLNKEPGKFFKWEKVDQTSFSVACRASHRHFVIETAKTGCFAVMVPTDSVSGKIIRCMTYISSEQSDDHLVARVYFFGDNGSDDVLHEIQRRENTYRGRLCDISGSFFLSNTSDNVLMNMTNLEGMERYLGGNEPMPITTEELYHKQLVCYMVEIIKKEPVGQCTINVWQENTALEQRPVHMNLQFSNEAKYPVIAPVPFLHTHMPPPTTIPVRCHQAVSRVSSAPLTQKASPSLVADRPRDAPHARSVPSRSRAADALLLKASDGSLQHNMLPFAIKRDLFLLLDPKLPSGNDWRMLASQLGLDAMIYYFDMQINPTMEVLKAFEIMNRPLSELEEQLRLLGRDDAADVVKMHLEKTGKVKK